MKIFKIPLAVQSAKYTVSRAHIYIYRHIVVSARGEEPWFAQGWRTAPHPPRASIIYSRERMLSSMTAYIRELYTSASITHQCGGRESTICADVYTHITAAQASRYHLKCRQMRLDLTRTRAYVQRLYTMRHISTPRVRIHVILSLSSAAWNSIAPAHLCLKDSQDAQAPLENNLKL